MELHTLLEPYRDRLQLPQTEPDPTLRVTDDYLEVLRSGVLSLDLAADLSVDPSKRDAVPFWARDIATVHAAEAVEAEELPAVLGSVFYKVGETYGGSYVVQINRGTRLGKLATIPDHALPSFECGEVPVPDAPIDDDRAADTYLEALEQAGGIRPHDTDLLGFVRLRLQSAARPT